MKITINGGNQKVNIRVKQCDGKQLLFARFNSFAIRAVFL